MSKRIFQAFLSDPGIPDAGAEAEDDEEPGKSGDSSSDSEAARAERRAHRKAVKKQLRLRFDDVRCFGGFERRSHPWT